MTSDHYIEGPNLSLSWAQAIRNASVPGRREVGPLVVSVTGFDKSGTFVEEPRIRKALDALLTRESMQSVDTVAKEIDDAEDGGRAQVIEEAIVAVAYSYAADHGFLEGLQNVDWHVLRLIKQLTANLEVRNVSTWEWNDALLRGFSVWRKLRAKDGGVVRGDLRAGTIEFIERSEVQTSANSAALEVGAAPLSSAGGLPAPGAPTSGDTTAESDPSSG